MYELLVSSGKIYIDENGKEFVKRTDNEGKEIVYYPPTQEEFFSEEEIREMDAFREI